MSLDDEDSLLFCIDKDITLTVQRQRPDLFFLHAAAVAHDGAAAILCASSGTGKSTLTLAALAHGLEYFSDELAPIDVERLTVEPYPHALYLKSPPPAPYSVPRDALEYSGRFYVPVEALPNVTHRVALPVVACLFLERDAQFVGARSITAASGVARLMAHALNPLAHPRDGLDAAVALGQAVPCFELDVHNLQAACAAIALILRA